MKGGMWTSPLLGPQPLPLGLGPPPTYQLNSAQRSVYTYGDGQRARERAKETGEGGGGGGAEEVGGGAEPDGLEEYNRDIDSYMGKEHGDEIINFGSLTVDLTLDEKGLLEKEYIVEGGGGYGAGAEEGSEGYGAGAEEGWEGYGKGFGTGAGDGGGGAEEQRYELVITPNNEDGINYGKLEIFDSSTGLNIDTQIRINENGQLLDYNSQSLEPYNSQGGDRLVYIQYISNLAGYPELKKSMLYIKLSTGILYYNDDYKNSYETAYVLNNDGVLIERVYGNPVTVV